MPTVSKNQSLQIHLFHCDIIDNGAPSVNIANTEYIWIETSPLHGIFKDGICPFSVFIAPLWILERTCSDNPLVLNIVL